jgi:hypothetical protein
MGPQQQTIPQSQGAWRLESRAAALERFLEKHEIWILAAWSLVYFAGTMLRALAKPFWYDEILTLLEARQPNLFASMRALGDVDWMPPAQHLTFYLWNKLAGSGEVAFRIPVIIAFWVFCICLYLFARRRVSIFFAFMAMLLPYASDFQSYSYEARGYAFMLGFCGIALVSWQAAAEGRMRPWSLICLAVGIAGAIFYQYWSVLIYLPLAGAEIYRSTRLRRIDCDIWAAFAAGGLALMASWLFILHGLKSWSSYTGLIVQPRAFFDFYAFAFHDCFIFAIPAALLLAVWFLGGGRKERPEGRHPAVIPNDEWAVALILLFLVPIAVVSIALILPPHSFSPRYAAPAVAGYALWGAFLAAHFAGRRSSIGLVCVLAALAPFLYLMTQPGHFRNPFQSQPGLEQQLQAGPVVVENLIFYLKLWYYTPDALKPRLFFLTGRQAAGYGGSPFREFSKLGVPVVPYRHFALPGTEFLFYAEPQSKLRLRIVDGGGIIETLGRSGDRILLRAHIN